MPRGFSEPPLTGQTKETQCIRGIVIRRTDSVLSPELRSLSLKEALSFYG